MKTLHILPLMLCLIAPCVLLAGGNAMAGGWHLWPRYPANLPYCRMERAGYPNAVAPYAKHSYDARYRGYYVGGGAHVGGERRCNHEGTFGVDYDPWWSKVALGWHHNHGDAGWGQYEPDEKVCPVPELAE